MSVLERGDEMVNSVASFCAGFRRSERTSWKALETSTGNIMLVRGSCLSSSASTGVEGVEDEADELAAEWAHEVEGVASETDSARARGARELRDSGGRTLVEEARERDAGRRRDDEHDGEEDAGEEDEDIRKEYRDGGGLKEQVHELSLTIFIFIFISISIFLILFLFRISIQIKANSILD